MFTNAMLEYLSLGHAELVPKSDLNKAVELTYYVPIHMVIKDSSTTTRYRPVFDASTQTTMGVSLNDQLLAGPSLYPLLNSLIHQFREHTVVFTGDISKMFRGIHLAPQERDLHRFLLRGEDNIIRDYRMNQLTFGMKSSPFLATRVLQKAAEDMKETYPLAAKIVKMHFYVDDILTGAETPEKAIELWRQVTELCKDAGLTLRMFRSNCKDLLNSIPEELQEKERTLDLAVEPTLHKQNPRHLLGHFPR